MSDLGSHIFEGGFMEGCDIHVPIIPLCQIKVICRINVVSLNSGLFLGKMIYPAAISVRHSWDNSHQGRIQREIDSWRKSQ